MSINAIGPHQPLQPMPSFEDEKVISASTDGLKKTQNYMIDFIEFMTEFLELSTLISETERTKTNDLKKQYLEATTGSADFIRDKGFYDIAFAVAGVGVYTLRVFTQSQIDQGMIDLTTRELLPNAKNLFASRIDARLRQIDAKQLLLGNEHQAKVTKSASDSGKQEYTNALREAFANSSIRG